jgi:hypothetical protein
MRWGQGEGGIYASRCYWFLINSKITIVKVHSFLSVIPASMWTKKEIAEFKESVQKEGGDSIIKVPVSVYGREALHQA